MYFLFVNISGITKTKSWQKVACLGGVFMHILGAEVEFILRQQKNVLFTLTKNAIANTNMFKAALINT